MAPPRGRPPSVVTLAEDVVLAVNQAFYDALAARDVEAMEALWSRDSPVACIHPGWNPLTDRDEIMAAWAAILRHPEPPVIEAENPRVLLFGDVAVVICHERIADALLICANTFRLESGVWRIVLHQAGPVGEEPEARGDGAPPSHLLH